jgi:hypothetical protein
MQWSWQSRVSAVLTAFEKAGIDIREYIDYFNNPPSPPKKNSNPTDG